MTTLAAIRDAVEDQLRDGLPDFSVARAITPNLPLPAVIVQAPLFGEGVDYRGTFGADGAWGTGSWTITAALSVQLTDELMTAALDIAEPTSDRSVYAVMEADQTLGGLLGAGGFVVMSARSTGVEAAEGLAWYGVEFTCQCAARKTVP